MEPCSRRQVLAALAASVAGRGLLRPARLAALPLGLPIGLQLYTVAAELEREFAATLAEIAAAGYREVESAGLHGRSAEQMRRELDAAGLRCTSAHADLRTLLADPERAIADAQALGALGLVCSFPWVADPARFAGAGNQLDTIRALWGGLGLDDWHWIASALNRLGERTRGAGLTLGYHNHNFELREYRGATALDHLVARTDPDLVHLQLDCGWVAAAGADPAELLFRFADRVRSLHVKDLRRDFRPSFELEAGATTEVGHGALDWPRIFAAARQAGVTRCYVEQEPPFSRPALEAIRASYDYLLGLEV